VETVRAHQVEEEPLPALYAELEQVLRDEARALKALDREGIDRAAAAKERICEELTVSRPALSAGQRAGVERLKKAMLRNHMLLAHARDSVRQVLGTASGRPASPVLGGLRLDVRG
jgi:hypothetical protein